MQVDREFLINVIMSNLRSWKDLFRSIRQVYDRDKNGFLTMEEMRDLFMNSYESQLEGKDIRVVLKNYTSPQNQNLVNYNKLREELGNIIEQRLKELGRQNEWDNNLESLKNSSAFS